MCEVQWLQKLKNRLQIHGSAPQLEDTNFYLDHRGLPLVKRDNPFHLPDQNLAILLVQCYHQTVHNTFPIVPVDLEGELRIYYNSVQSGHAATMFPHNWYAIVNLVLAIGARFSHLTSAPWRSDVLDETLYISQAYQLLRLEDPVTALTPDLSTVQVRAQSIVDLAMLTTAGYWTPCVLSLDHWSRQQVRIAYITCVDKTMYQATFAA